MAAKSRSSFQITATPVTIFVHLLVISIVTLVLVWLLHFREGLAFKSDNKAKIFNLHPLFMIIGFLLFAGEGIIAYKTVPATRRAQKVVHLTLLFVALACGIIGIYAVFKFHNELEISNMYSLHSWIGISTICLFGLQWLLAFFSFMFPGAQMSTRARILPWHSFVGMVIFLMAILSAELGLVERFIFLGLQLQRSQEALIVNFTGLLILLFAIGVALTAILPRGY